MIKENFKVDLHIHTTASDGTWTNEELLQQIKEKNIKIFSITDHDTITNSVKMIDMIPKDIYYFVGVEISTTYKGKEYHITAYDFDIHNKKLNELLSFNENKRKEFNAKLIQHAYEINKLENIKSYDSYNYDKKRGGWDSLNYLYDNKAIDNLNDYFDLIKSYNEKLVFKEPHEVIEIIKNAGGHSFLAHPSAYESGKILPSEVLKEWRDFGISGVECYSPYLNNINDAEIYWKFCRDNMLMISGGSDCHGDFNSRYLGDPEVNIWNIQIDFLERFL